MNRVTGLTFVLFFIIFAGVFGFKSCGSLKHDTLTTKVIDLQQQQLVSSSGTKIRYVVVGENETFICESSPLNFKFANSDIFLRLKKDSTYTFDVCGFGKTFMTDYRNILSYKKAK